MMLLFMNSAVGFMITHRILAKHSDEFAFTQQIFSLIATLNVVFFLLLTRFCSSSFTLWIFIGILIITLKYFPVIFRIFLLKRLARSLIPLFDHVILGLQSGKSFRQSMIEAIEIREGWMRNQLRDLFNSVVLGDDSIVFKSAVLKDLQLELMEIDRSQNRVVDQVRALRRHLKIQEDFRRRSGQVTQQIKMQALIVTVLYGALLTFVIVQFGGKAHAKIILFSSFIFICGLISVFQIGKRIQWKV